MLDGKGEERGIGRLQAETVPAHGAEFVLLDFDGGLISFAAYHPAAGHQLEVATVVQLHWPADGDFEAPSGHERPVRTEANPAAADVDGDSPAQFMVAPLVDNPVNELALDGESVAFSAVG